MNMGKSLGHREHRVHREVSMDYPLSPSHPMGENPKPLSATLSLCPLCPLCSLWLDLPFLK